MPTISLNTTQAGAQITRGNVSWGQNVGDAVADLTFGFRASAPLPTYGNGEAATFARVNGAEKAAVIAALAQWGAVANISFVPVNTDGYTDDAAILVSNYSAPPKNNSAAHAYFPQNKDRSPEAVDGDLWFNLTSDPYTSLPRGSYNYSTVVHELGHALGLDHPGDYNAGDVDQKIEYGTHAEYIEDTLQYSIMSYFEAYNTFANHVFNGQTVYASTPLRDDIAALQRLYGANMSTRTGDTVYGFNSNADDVAYHITGNNQVVFSIWDAGGNDTIDLSGYSYDQTIDLRPTAFSDAGALTKNISIALNVVIENAIGGSGNDTIIGNDVRNDLRGNAGNDVLFGGADIDTAFYTATYGSSQIKIILDKFVADENTTVVTTMTEGVDTLFDVERLQFSDALVAVDIEGHAGQAYRLYQASFNRTPDQAGVSYWINELDNGMAFGAVAASFMISNEFRTAFGDVASMDDIEFLGVLYGNILVRDPDTAGLAYWEDELERGMARELVLASFSESDENKELVGVAIAEGIVLDPVWFV